MYINDEKVIYKYYDELVRLWFWDEEVDNWSYHLLPVSLRKEWELTEKDLNAYLDAAEDVEKH